MSRTLMFLCGFAAASFVPSSLTAPTTAPRTAPLAARDDEKPEDAVARKRKKVEDLMTVMDQHEIARRSIDASLDTFTEMGLPEAFKTCFRDKFDIDHVVELTTDIYVEHLEESTIDALVAFYRTEEGQAFCKATPDIMVDALKRSSKYGKEIGEDCARSSR